MIVSRTGRYLAARFAGDLFVSSALAGVLAVGLAMALGVPLASIPFWSIGSPLVLVAAAWTRRGLVAHGEDIALATTGSAPAITAVGAGVVALVAVAALALAWPASDGDASGRRAGVSTEGDLALVVGSVVWTWSVAEEWPRGERSTPAALRVPPGFASSRRDPLTRRRRAFFGASPFAARGSLAGRRWAWLVLGPLGSVLVLAARHWLVRTVPAVALVLIVWSL